MYPTTVMQSIVISVRPVFQKYSLFFPNLFTAFSFIKLKNRSINICASCADECWLLTVLETILAAAAAFVCLFHRRPLPFSSTERTFVAFLLFHSARILLLLYFSNWRMQMQCSAQYFSYYVYLYLRIGEDNRRLKRGGWQVVMISYALYSISIPIDCIA